MEFSWIQTFLTAAKCGNFKRTSEILFISQPSVTVHIQNLEKELGVHLFQKEGRRVKLTEEGKRYVSHAEQLMKVYQQGLEDLQTFSQGYTSKLTLAISPLNADTILPSVLKKFMKLHPHVELSVKVLDSEDIEQAVLREKIDLGISCLPATDSNLFCQLLHTDDVKLIAPHDGLCSESGPPLDEEEVLTSNILLTDNHPVYWDHLNRMVKHHFPNTRMMKVSQINITKRFIAEGLGISFLPESTVRREILEGRLMEVPCPTIKLPQASTYVVLKYEHTMQKQLMKFLQQFKM